MTDYKQLCAELTDCLEKADWPHRYKVVFQQWMDIAHAALAEPEPEGPTVMEIIELAGEIEAAKLGQVDLVRAALARWAHQPAPAPVPVSERLPERIERALIKAECALSDIAEGEAEESEGDALEWAEKRAADALARIRPVMRQHQIQTSEWPPLPAHALPLPAGEVEA